MRLLLLAIVIGSWAMIAPPHSGPDEPGHIVESAALVRQASIIPGDAPGFARYDIPATIGHPDPGCYAFRPDIPASCLRTVPTQDADGRPRAVLRSEYPVWGRISPGVGSLLPPPFRDVWGPRVLDALIPALLLAGSMSLLTRRHGRGGVAVLMALSPTVLFTIGVVNPSGAAIAGGIATWTVLRTGFDEPPGVVGGPGWSATRRKAFLVAALAACLLVRRDGLLWTSLILAVPTGLGALRPVAVWRALGWRSQLAVVALYGLACWWALTNTPSSNGPMIAAPMLLLFAAGVHRLWTSGPRGALTAAAVLVASVALGFVAAAIARPSGFNWLLFQLIVRQTGDNLIEAIGVIGWLDTKMPWLVIGGWCLVLGVLVAAAVQARDRATVVGAATIVVVSIVVAWIVESSLERYSGTHWQGRYYLPLLCGAAVWLAGEPSRTATDRSVSILAGAGWVVLVNAGLIAAARRWGVGVGGSLAPWDWDTYSTPLPVLAVLVVHVVASSALVWSVVPAVDQQTSGDEPREMAP